MKLTIISITVIALIAAIGFFIKTKIDTQMMRMKTFDTMGQILVTLDKSLNSKSINGYNPAMEARKIYPLIPEKDGQILDAWGQPISLAIQPAENGFQIHIISAGPDKTMGTADDIIKDEFLRN